MQHWLVNLCGNFKFVLYSTMKISEQALKILGCMSGNIRWSKWFRKQPMPSSCYALSKTVRVGEKEEKTARILQVHLLQIRLSPAMRLFLYVNGQGADLFQVETVCK